MTIRNIRNHRNLRFYMATTLCAVAVGSAGVFSAAAQTAVPPTATPLPVNTATPAALPTEVGSPTFVPSLVPTDSALATPALVPTVAPVVEGDLFEVEDAQPVTLDSETDGDLTEAQPVVYYTLELEDGQSFEATLISEDFDSYLVLLDGDGVELAANDDDRVLRNLDSRIIYTAEQTGTVTLAATSYGYRNRISGSGSIGAFTLAVNEVEIDLVEYSQNIEGEFTTNSLTARYDFRGQAGDAVIINMESEDFDSSLRLLDASGLELAYNDDRGDGTLNSRIGPFTLPETGSYQIVASSLSGTAVGEYSLTLDRIEVSDIAYGDETEVTLSAGGQAYLEFEATFDDVISISVESDADTTVALIDPYNYTLVTDTDSGSGFNPEILNYVVNQAGTHRILITSADGSGETATVSLERGELPSLDDGALTLNFTPSVTTRVITFTPEAYTNYRLTIETPQDFVFQPSVSITQDGSTLGSVSGSNTSRVSVDFSPYSTSPLRITVSDYSYADVEAVVTIEEVIE